MRKSKQLTRILFLFYCILSILFCSCIIQKQSLHVKSHCWNISTAKIEYISYRVRTRTSISTINEFENAKTLYKKYLSVDSIQANLVLKNRLPNSTLVDLRRKLVISDSNGKEQVFYYSMTGICLWRDQYYRYDGNIRAVLSEVIGEEW